MKFSRYAVSAQLELRLREGPFSLREDATMAFFGRRVATRGLGGVGFIESIRGYAGFGGWTVLNGFAGV